MNNTLSINVACLTQESPAIVEPFACNLCQLDNIGRVDVFYHDYYEPEDIQDKDMLIIIPNPNSLLFHRDISHYVQILNKISCKNKIVINVAIQINLSPEILFHLEKLYDVAKQHGATTHLHYGKIKNFNKNIKNLINSITENNKVVLNKKHKASWLSKLNANFWAPTT